MRQVLRPYGGYSMPAKKQITLDNVPEITAFLSTLEVRSTDM